MDRIKTFRKNEIIEVKIDDIGYDGEGIAHAEGVTIFIKHALPNEVVRAKIIFVKKTFCVALIEEIIVKSEFRQTPACPYFFKCGGCSFQHTTYNYQLELKRKAISETIKKIFEKELFISEVVASDKEFNCRNKLSLPVASSGKGDDQEIQIGFYAKNSHRVVEIEDCILQKNSVKNLLQEAKVFFAKNKFAGYNEEEDSGEIRHIVLREIGSRAIVTIVGRLNKSQIELLKNFSASLEKIYNGEYAFYYNHNVKVGNRILGDEFTFLGGKNTKLMIDGLTLSVHPNAFFQVNDYIRGKIYSRVIELVIKSGNAVTIDAFSGVAMLSAFIAKTGYVDKVYAIEINKDASKNSRELKVDNNVNGDLENLEIITGDVKDVLPNILKEAKNGVTLILDPPRIGCDKEILATAIKNNISEIIYISCNPATLARDLKILSDFYFIEEITPYDMFVQTSAVEMIARLVRK